MTTPAPKVETEYSSALVDFLDRDTDDVKRAMLYPVSSVELNVFTDAGVTVQRRFVVQGKVWVEVEVQ